MIFAGAALALTCCSLTVRLDMVDLIAAIDTGLYAGDRGSVTVKHAIGWMHRAYRGHKKASRAAPARHTCIPRWDWSGCAVVRKPASARCRPHGSRRSTG